jgi:hypothetical protein
LAFQTRRFEAGIIGVKGAVRAHVLRTLAERSTLIDDPWRFQMTIGSG